ncbi:MAG: DNA repair protein RecO [Desulfobacterales bacterium]|jgi:DNA repair protein RecO (recombination protein O)
MPNFSTPAILLRRINFGDYDLIITFFTLQIGKLTVIAKSAKKSTKRFFGILELFSVLEIVVAGGGQKGLPVLQEAALKQPFANIRADITKTGYASYWAELIDVWLEDGVKQVDLFRLFQHVLEQLDHGNVTDAAASILFQMRFTQLSGHSPNLRQCSVCRTPLENIETDKVLFNPKRGGLVCQNCDRRSEGHLSLSKGTVKQLLWVEKGDLTQAGRIRFTPQALNEGLQLLEAFVPYHLGKEPRSLKFLRDIRQD